jgi:hypothetical protein
MGPELELCRDAEEQICDAEKVLLEAGPDMKERCEARLSRAIENLQRLGALPRAHRSSDFIAGLRRIRRAARILRLQAQHGSNLCLGLTQFTADPGYTADGSPLPGTNRKQSIWEA